MRLGIDMDGVIADFNSGWVARYNDEHHASVDLDDIDHWDAIPGLTHFRHMGEFWRWASDLDGASLFRHLDPYPGAIEALERLSRDHEIVIVTTKPGFAVHDTYEWIAEHRVPTTEVHITDEKWTVPCDVYLDDGPHNLRDLLAHRPQALVCRYVRPWNRPLSGTVDVTDWPEFEHVVAAR